MYTFPQNCMNIEEGMGNLQILNTDVSRGDPDIQRSVTNWFY